MLNTLPTVLNILPVEKAQDARSFMLSFQYWWGNADNCGNLAVMLADKYVFPRATLRPALEVAEPVCSRIWALAPLGAWGCSKTSRNIETFGIFPGGPPPPRRPQRGKAKAGPVTSVGC